MLGLQPLKSEVPSLIGQRLSRKKRRVDQLPIPPLSLSQKGVYFLDFLRLTLDVLDFVIKLVQLVMQLSHCELQILVRIEFVFAFDDL